MSWLHSLRWAHVYWLVLLTVFPSVNFNIKCCIIYHILSLDYKNLHLNTKNISKRANVRIYIYIYIYNIYIYIRKCVSSLIAEDSQNLLSLSVYGVINFILASLYFPIILNPHLHKITLVLKEIHIIFQTISHSTRVCVAFCIQ